jgi:hypothetical protein
MAVSPETALVPGVVLWAAAARWGGVLASGMARCERREGDAGAKMN